mmetsp:Transcript_29270/g.93906  ORF Transcript_29270/g.93906 Transcript_29270/m.93906 type:complete len:86 (-) Transcript_29270:20-277(-)
MDGVRCDPPTHPVSGSQRGLPFQYTAMMLPVMAIQTTLTAEGTLTLKAPKCKEANRKPKAELFMAVSMATVRQIFSFMLAALQAK